MTPEKGWVIRKRAEKQTLALGLLASTLPSGAGAAGPLPQGGGLYSRGGSQVGACGPAFVK